MSGHSHAKTVKRTKDANAAKRGKAFSKLSRLITITAQEGGDANFNSKLKQAIELARKNNMPKENIERALQKGTGALEGEKLEEVVYEALGPMGSAFIIQCITDNRNRTISDIRQALQKRGAKMANENSIKWMFKQKGIIKITWTEIDEAKKEEMEIIAIDCGAEDLKWTEEEGEKTLIVFSLPEEMEKIKSCLEEKGITIDSSIIGWRSKESISLQEKDREACQKIIEELSENDEAQEIYSNLKN